MCIVIQKIKRGWKWNQSEEETRSEHNGTRTSLLACPPLVARFATVHKAAPNSALNLHEHVGRSNFTTPALNSSTLSQHRTGFT